MLTSMLFKMFEILQENRSFPDPQRPMTALTWDTMDTMDTQVLDEEAKEGIAFDAPSADGGGACGDEHSPVEKNVFFAEPQWKLPTNLMIDIH